MRNRHEATGKSYEQIAKAYVPRSTLKPNKAGGFTYGEFKDFQVSYQAAAEVLNASPATNPIPGVTHFHDLRVASGHWPGTMVQYGSGKFIWYKGVK
jgi:hypothetical protein